MSYYKLNDNNLRAAFIAGLERDLMVSQELDMENVEKKIKITCGGKIKVLIYQEGEERCFEPPYGTGMNDM